MVTTDALVAGVHFLWPGDPRLIAVKALRKNLSDLAAMGAEPLAYSLALQLPATCDTGWLRCFAAGLAETQAASGIHLSGGDSAGTPGPVTICITAFGLVPQGLALRRNGARPSDGVWVSGTLGDAVTGLRLARDGGGDGLAAEDRQALIDRHWVPPLHLELGQGLRGIASAAMDVSDGLVGDLQHIARTSGCDIRLEAGALPLSGAFRRAQQQGLCRVEDALTGGDDYELVFTVPVENRPRLLEIAKNLGVTVTEVGAVLASTSRPDVQVWSATGERIVLNSPGWRHF